VLFVNQKRELEEKGGFFTGLPRRCTPRNDEGRSAFCESRGDVQVGFFKLANSFYMVYGAEKLAFRRNIV